jgi:hypothetical protein
MPKNIHIIFQILYIMGHIIINCDSKGKTSKDSFVLQRTRHKDKMVLTRVWGQDIK